MVHPITEDLLDFNAVKRPPNIAENIAHLENAKDPNEIKHCLFCKTKFSGLSGVKIHVAGTLKRIKEKGDDSDQKHDFDKT